MRQSVEDVKRVASILGSALDSTVIHDEFGLVVVRLEARGVTDAQLASLAAFSSEINSRGANGHSARVRVDPVSRRVYYTVPEKTSDNKSVEVKPLRDALRQAGVQVLNGH